MGPGTRTSSPGPIRSAAWSSNRRTRPASSLGRKSPFWPPALHHVATGQYKAGTTFAEGLVLFKGRWYLYYGTADSYVAVAVSR